MKPLLAASVVAVVMAVGGLFLSTGPAFADFVCPILPISDKAVENSDAGFAQIGEGDYTIITTIAPNHNTGAPPTAHGVPGDSDYTAIWDQDVDPGATLNPQD